MKVAALFSGGKDSTYAVYLAQQRGWSVSRLITLVPVNGESYMFHVPNIWLTGMLAEALGIPHNSVETDGEEEKELEDLREALQGHDAEGVLTGAIASDYQSTRIDRLCFESGMRSFSPLWRWSQMMVLEDMVRAGFKVMMVGVYAEGLGEDWLGRILDKGALAELADLSGKYGINVSGEGGEFETLVVDGPNFLKKLEIVRSEKRWHGNSGELVIYEGRLDVK